jgi:dienelactone hydrolase
MIRRSRLGSVSLLVVLAFAGCGTRRQPDIMGAYRLEDGRLVSIRKDLGKTFRVRFYSSGETRRLHRDGQLRYVAGPGFSAKKPIETVVEFAADETGAVSGLTWRREGAAPVAGERIGREEQLNFDNEGATLVGRLNLPSGPGPHPAVVLVHGSGSHAATDYFFNGDFLAAHGIAALTYDKRGTGGSSGELTFDFHQLARDVVAAVENLASRNDIDGRRIGLSGYSQGAWVAPLAAAACERVRYVIVHYGLIASPAEEARVETRNTLRRRGVDEASLEQLDELTLASVAVVASGFREGWDDLAALKRKYRREPWTTQLSGTVVGKFVRYPRWLIKRLGPRAAPPGMPWYYDSTETLEELSIPMVWLLAEEDGSAPIELALPALRRMESEGKPYEVIVFPKADHTMLMFSEASGTRIYTGYAPDYFRTEVEAARRLSAPASAGRSGQGWRIPHERSESTPP